MKKRILSLALVGAMCVALLASCGGKKNATWKVTCPWAPSGVAAMVSQKAATKSTEYSDTITLVAEAIKGDAATVNTWVADTKANDTELVFVGEGLLSITSILDPAKMQFGYEDFVFVENLYSSIFVLSADAKLNIGSVADLEAYVQQGTEISVAVNGATSSEAFLVFSDKVNIFCKFFIRFFIIMLPLDIKINCFIAASVQHHFVNDIQPGVHG